MSPAKKNVLANYVNFAVVALLGLVANPLLVGYLGTTSFGAWKAVLQLLGFATVADGRATQALKWFIAREASSADTVKKQRQVGAAIIVWLIWLPLLLLLQVGIVVFLPSLINDIPPEYDADLRLLGVFLALNVMISGIAMLPDSVLVGSNMGYRSMMVTTVVTVFSNCAMIMSAYKGFGIPLLGLILVTTTLINCLITTLVAKRHVGWLGMARPEREDVSRMAKFSGWVLIWALLTRFFLSSEIILLGMIVGAAAVTSFVFTAYVVQFALAICLMTASAAMPTIGRFLSDDAASASEIASDIREVVFALATAICCLMLLLNGPFVRLWAGEEYFLGPKTNVLMALAFLQLALIRCDAQIQRTGLQISKIVMIGVGSTLLSFGMGYLLLKETSSVSWMLAGLIIGRLPMSIAYPNLVGKMFATHRYLTRRTVFSALALAALCVLLAPHVPNGPGFLAYALLGVVVIPTFCFYALLRPKLRYSVRSVFRSWKRKGD